MIVFLILLALFWFLFIPAVIALVVPARYFGFAVAWMVMVAFVYALLPSGPDHSSPFSGLGHAADRFMFTAFLVAVGLKGGLIAFLGHSIALSRRENAALWALTGLVAGAFAVIWPMLILSRTQPAWIALVIAAGVLLAAWSWTGTASLTPRLFASTFTASALATAVAVGVWTASWIKLVVADAESIAAERSYCIQVPGGRRDFNEFVPAVTWLDLSPVTMHADCRSGWCWQNHAILIVDEEAGRAFKNWSYRRRGAPGARRRRAGFLDDVLNLRTRPPAVVCQPKPHFARDLPLF